MEIFENFLEDMELFRIFENFCTDSRSTGMDRQSSVGIFFLSTSVPEVTCLEGYISQTIGPRDSVYERMLYFGIRVEWHWNHLYITFRSGCVLLEGEMSKLFSQK